MHYSLYLFLDIDDNTIKQNNKGDTMKDSLINLLTSSNASFTTGPYRTNDAWIKCGNMFAYVIGDKALIGMEGGSMGFLNEYTNAQEAYEFLNCEALQVA